MERPARDFIDDTVDLGIVRCRIGHAAVKLADKAWNDRVEIDQQFIDSAGGGGMRRIGDVCRGAPRFELIERAMAALSALL
jgi:hypothetical protein